MTIYEFMNVSPWTTLFLTLIAASVAKTPFYLVQRWIRHLDIKQHGWPPVHCDADGDAVEEDEQD